VRWHLDLTDYEGCINHAVAIEIIMCEQPESCACFRARLAHRRVLSGALAESSRFSRGQVQVVRASASASTCCATSQPPGVQKSDWPLQFSKQVSAGAICPVSYRLVTGFF
jgi:hypothetical protein